MAATKNSLPTPILTVLALVGTPWILAMLVTRWVVHSNFSTVTDAGVLTIANDVTNSLLWFLLPLCAGSLFFLWQWARKIFWQSAKTEQILQDVLKGNLTAAEMASKELDSLPHDVIRIMQQSTEKKQNVQRLLDKQRRTLEESASITTSLSETLRQQKDTLLTLQETTGANRTFIQEIAENIDTLARSAEATSSSILQMVAINNEVTENIHHLSMSVQETTTAIEQMTFSVKEVARNIEDLSTTAEETAASMNEMDVSISQVESNANETSRLSETVTSDAETGVTTINRTIQGIDRIKESNSSAAAVITNLGEKIDEIGNILTVIDDVAEQTNLLALNAAIIAAQAGEHGRGFAVVADEIKALAERTGASTKEIAELIKTVQSESRNAITTMSKGVIAVEEGVQLGHNAEEALIKIVDSAKRSTLMIKAIAQATVEQAKGSKQVTNAISRIAETVQQIALATSEQAKGSEQIMKSAERMRTITQQVERSTEEQNRGGRQVTESVESIREAVEHVNRAQEKHEQSSSRLADASAHVAESGGKAAKVCSDLERHLAQLAQHLDGIVQDVNS